MVLRVVTINYTVNPSSTQQGIVFFFRGESLNKDRFKRDEDHGISKVLKTHPRGRMLRAAE